MNENRKKILQMLAEGKISVEEAARLLSLMGEESGPEVNGAASADVPKPNPKYLYIRVEPKAGHHSDFEHKGHGSFAEHGRVNVRIPVGLIRAGIKLKALIPPQVAEDVNRAMKDKGMSFDIRDLKDEYLEELLTALCNTGIDVDSEEAELHISAE